MNIAEIKKILSQEPSLEELTIIASDERLGVQKLYAAYERKIEAAIREKERFDKMLAFEREYWRQGIRNVAGVDEAGRGPLAGPLVVAAVILPANVFISGLNDSKQLSAKVRERLYDEVCQKAISIVINIVSVAEIDQYNIYQATKLSMEKVVAHLNPKPAVTLIDAMPVHAEDMKIVSLIHGDALSASIAAASVIAKVTRDRIMLDLDKEYPEYDFVSNKGYGSQKHMEAIKKYGATLWHRRPYEPIKSLAAELLSVEVDSRSQLIVLK
ncbi:Ribonuclease HII [bioreactor metagenome]|uniref:Ribonuclease HII n=1 Tax=bioreactor metagenome TaxID=1076179 RepID=A0A645ETQ1_9ZZZZ